MIAGDLNAEIGPKTADDKTDIPLAAAVPMVQKF